MLRELRIENIAVIERVEIAFSPGLNIFTGETGAGKSIIIDSLDAVLGGRVSRALMRAGAERASICAVFDISGLEDWLSENGLATEDDELILLRTFSSDGRSACRISGAPVPTALLKELGSMLLDIHGQNDGRVLMDESRHREYLDSFGGYRDVLLEYRSAFDEYTATEREIERLTFDETEKERLIFSLSRDIEDISGAGIRVGELEEAESRLALIRNAGKLTEFLSAAFDALYDDENSAVAQTAEAVRLLERGAAVAEGISGILSAATDARYMLEDAAEQLRDLKNSLDFSPEELDYLETRLSEIARLCKRFGPEEADVLAYLEECKSRLSEFEFSDATLVKLKSDLTAKEKSVREKAGILSERRRASAGILEERITSELTGLSMPSVRFRVELLESQTPPGFDRNGSDEVRFLISANAGEEPGRISRIASGGELSRIMLAMKNVLSENDAVGTLVFDEIDAGVSGIAAQRVGEKLCGLSKNKQVLCVTHLPQIAAMADTHFVIEKEERGGRTFTAARALTWEGRKEELSRLHGGDVVTPVTLNAAEEQLIAAREYKDGVLIS